jgi:threonine synthase
LLALNPNVRGAVGSRTGSRAAGPDLRDAKRRPAGLCECCAAPGSPLLIEYATERDLLASSAARSGRGLWRFAPLLPVLGVEPDYAADVGDTPIVPVPRLGDALDVELLAKCEGSNPTGSFKDRGLAVATALAVAQGARRLCLPTQGNAGVSAALFCARLGLPPALVWMPEGQRGSAYHRDAEQHGADVRFSGRHIGEAGTVMREVLARELAVGECVDVSTFREPGRLEGKKTLGFEIAEQLGSALPDWILYPTGGGTGLVGIWKGLAELRALGRLPENVALPRMVAVQAEGCAPVVRAFAAGADDVEPVASRGTVADGLDVPSAIMGHGILRTLRESGGQALAVPDLAILAASRELGQLGVDAGLEGAATLAALRELRKSGRIPSRQRVLLLITS